MTLEEGIIHAEDVARMKHEAAKHLTDEHPTQAEKCEVCAEEHRQLAEWLKELKAYKEQRGKIMNVEEKERLIKKDIASIENRVRHVFNQGYEMGVKKNKSGIPTSCGDVISRAKVYEMLRIWLEPDDADRMILRLDEKIPSVTQQPCEDAISRQAVDDAIYDYSRSCDVNYQQIMEFIEKIPSVTPQQRTGRWIPVGYDGYADGNPVYDWWECSECGWEHTGDEESLTAFCPNCGAEMEVEE